jgi:NodT family efflux transporter outer membrane factor (OMF) lipoprotein
VILRRSISLICACLLLACAAPPQYQPPAPDLPVSWKAEAPWREGRPKDAAPKGAWWAIFGDSQLDALQAKVMASNPTLALAQARLAQARSLLAASSAGALPQIGLAARATSQKISANRPLSNYSSPNFSTVQGDFSLATSVSYELDLAGRVQQSIAGAQATSEQAAADLENTRLLLSADLAVNYFNLRAIDTELDVLGRSIALQRRSLELVSARYELGAASGLDLAQQQTLLETTLVQLDLLRRQRGQFEHAIATLSGTAAPLFDLPTDRRELTPPAVPFGVPSDLLQRRPDIAAAERAMAAANAQIGVANAAFYPSIILGAALGGDSRDLATLFDAPSLLWSFGLSAAQTLFDGGRIQANVDYASAGYAAAVANYRRVVLLAMQEVEDGVSALAALERAAVQSRAAVAAARRAFEMTLARYEGGASAYLDVVITQQALLSSERQTVQLQGQRLVSTVFLIKALGGSITE